MESKSQFPPDDEIMIIDDDSDEDTTVKANDNNARKVEQTLMQETVQNDEMSSCRNPVHSQWGNNDTNYKWQSQVSAVAQQVFRHLGYERQPGTRCKFCESCVTKAQNLSDRELQDIEKNSKIKLSRRQSENASIQAQLEKLSKMDISDEERNLQTKQLRMLAFVNPGKFMEDFNPETSTREMKKMNRRIYKEKQAKKNTLYDEQGLVINGGHDLCDCLDRECPGCHFPCSKCSSEKCGGDCRCSRRWIYEYVESEGHGKDSTVVWPFDT